LEQLISTTSEINIGLSSAPLAGQVLTALNATTAIWQTFSSNPNLVTGPASSTNTAIVRFNGSTGKIIENSGVVIDNLNNIIGANWAGSTITVPSGGTGLTTIPVGKVLVGNGILPIIATKNVPVGNFVGDTDSQSLINKVMTGSTNILTATLLKSATTEISVGSAVAPIAGQVLTATSPTAATWQTVAVNPANVIGPNSANSNAIPRFNGTSGTLLQNSGVIIDASNNIAGGTWTGNTIDVIYGGTGQTNFPLNNILVGNGSGAINSIVPPSGGLVGITASQSLINKTMDDNSNNIISRGLFTANSANVVSTYVAANPVSGQVLTATTSTTATWQTPPVIASGTYIPVVSGSINVSSTSASTCYWSRNGNVITVGGQVTAIATIVSNLVSFEITLPVPSNFTDSTQCSGTGQATDITTPWLGITITSNSISNNAVFTKPNLGAFLYPTTGVWSFNLVYVVL